MQGDRTMPGQRGVRMPFLGGEMIVPTGPVRLAMATGATILPVFCVRRPDGAMTVIMDEPITMDDMDLHDLATHPAQVAVAAALERVIGAHPEQWLAIHRAFLDDDEAGRGG